MELCTANPCNPCAGHQFGRIQPTMPVMLLAERLVGEARQRRANGMDRRERTVTCVSTIAYLAVAVAIALLVPDERNVDPLVTLGLLLGYALILAGSLRVRWCTTTSPEQLAFVPLLLLGPLPLVPLLVAAAGVLSHLPQIARSSWHRQRWVDGMSSSWMNLGGVLVLAALAPGILDADLVWVYALAFIAHLAKDLGWTLVRNQLLDRLQLREVLSGFAGTARIDGILAPVASWSPWAPFPSRSTLLRSARSCGCSSRSRGIAGNALAAADCAGPTAAVMLLSDVVEARAPARLIVGARS